jgi:hypothetical protein
VIQLQSLAFGSFAEAEPLNPHFAAGHPKLRMTVDSETAPEIPERALLEELTTAFPGLSDHLCQMSAPTNGEERPRGIVLLEDEPSANQAHLLEHLVLEMLSYVDRLPRLSGVTCAYATPPERNDVFVECNGPDSAAFVGLLAIDAMNAALSRRSIAPLFPDAVRCARPLLHPGSKRTWASGDLGRASRLDAERAAAALQHFMAMGVVQREAYALNLSGEMHYRFLGAPRAAPSLPAQ